MSGLADVYRFKICIQDCMLPTTKYISVLHWTFINSQSQVGIFIINIYCFNFAEYIVTYQVQAIWRVESMYRVTV